MMGIMAKLPTASIACLGRIARVEMLLRAPRMLPLPMEPQWRRRASAIVGTMALQISPVLLVRRGHGAGPA
jgi:hypothetical protein